MTIIRRLRGVTVAGLLTVASLVAAPVAAQASPNPLANPTTSYAPSGAFTAACASMGTSKADNDACDAAALNDFDQVRKFEGLGAMTLPTGFDQMSVPDQLLAITNVERVDRGLIPASGLAPRLNTLAKAGALADADPAFPPNTGLSAGGSNWSATGNSALLADFYWMYDDGLGSPNGDCSPGDPSGCWGHRDNILGTQPGVGAYQAPLFMGAAVAYGTPDGTSMTEEFLDQDTVDSAEALPVTVSANELKIIADTAKPVTTTLTATAQISGAAVTVSVPTGSASWHVTPRSCTLAGAAHCVLHIRFAPPSTGHHNGSILLATPGGSDTVKLVGWQAPPRVSITASSKSVAAGYGVTILGRARSYGAKKPLPHQRFSLQQRVAHGPWQTISKRRAGATGRVRVRVHPTASASYRFVALAADGASESHSKSVHVRVT